MKCLVSGATGFIGKHLCGCLERRGDSVIAFSKGGGPLPSGMPTRALDLSTAMPEVEELRGIDVVFHLAGIAHQQAPAEAYQALNERATLELARLAAAAGVGCFVFLSSIKAMGPPPDERVRSESDCTAPQDPYSWSKWSAENALLAEFARSSMRVVILRPTLVYGPMAKGNLALLAKGVRAGMPRPPARGARSMLALDNLVDLMLLFPAGVAPGVHTWIVCDEERYTTRGLYDELRRASGRGEGLAWLPLVGWRLGSALLDRLTGAVGGSTYDKLFGTELYSNEAVQSATGWSPRTRFPEIARQLMEQGGRAV